MIAYLNGVVRERHPARVVLEVHGVGYEVQVPARTFQQLPAAGAAAALFVHTHVREDAIQLFGFAAAAERELFERLLAVNGVGPRMGLAVLSVLSPDELARAVQAHDLARLTTVPGVGKKTAERLVIELRDKLPAGGADTAAAAAPLGGTAEDVLSALVNLGYAPAPSAQAVQRALQKFPSGSFDELFTACMKAL